MVYPIKVGGWFHDRYFPEGVQVEQVSVAGDDHIGGAADGQVEEFVIRRVAALVESVADRWQLDDPAQQAHELLALAESQVAVELRSAQYSGQFFECGI